MTAAAAAGAGTSVLAATDSKVAPLANRTREAKRITLAERQRRITKAQQLMGENKLGAIAVAGGTSLQYFSGVRWGTSERMFIMVLPAKGNPFFVVPAFEKDRAMEQISVGPFGNDFQVVSWEEDDSPYQKTAVMLKERGLATASIGIEETTDFVFADGIGKAATQAKITSATPVTAGCRMIKSPEELTLMRFASDVTLKAFEWAYKQIKEGMTREEFNGLIQAGHAQQGYVGGAMVLVAEGSALPHGTLKPQVVREGTIILIDGGCTVEGYRSDISRTFTVGGKATDKMKQVFEIVQKAQAAALKATRPGAACEAVDAAARKVIVDAGYGPGYTYFTHRVGHGMGMDGHEWPYLVKQNTRPLEPGMTFSDEPGIYIKGEFGVRLEDDMVVTENGAELFTGQSRSLDQPFANL
ncbi:MAG: aminopeptidase P family protein [Acidobacteria bacterium]|nr:aminopeptidase P family protein [Acidobacteriota bacterium]